MGWGVSLFEFSPVKKLPAIRRLSHIRAKRGSSPVPSLDVLCLI